MRNLFILIILTGCISKANRFDEKIIGKWCAIDSRHPELKRIDPFLGKYITFTTDSVGFYDLDKNFISKTNYDIIDSVVRIPNLGRMENLYKIKLLTKDTLIVEVMHDKLILKRCE